MYEVPHLNKSQNVKLTNIKLQNSRKSNDINHVTKPKRTLNPVLLTCATLFYHHVWPHFGGCQSTAPEGHGFYMFFFRTMKEMQHQLCDQTRCKFNNVLLTCTTLFHDRAWTPLKWISINYPRRPRFFSIFFL